MNFLNFPKSKKDAKPSFDISKYKKPEKVNKKVEISPNMKIELEAKKLKSIIRKKHVNISNMNSTNRNLFSSTNLSIGYPNV